MLVLSLFVNLLALAVPIFTMQVYDRVIFKAGMSTLQGLVIGMVLVVVFDNVLRQARSRIMQKAALRIDLWVGRKLIQKLLALPLATLESRPNAHWQALFRDTEMVRNTISGPTTLLVADLPFAILFLALIFVIAKPIVWVLAIILPTFVFLAWRSANKLSTVSNVEKQTGFGRDSRLLYAMGQLDISTIIEAKDRANENLNLPVNPLVRCDPGRNDPFELRLDTVKVLKASLTLPASPASPASPAEPSSPRHRPGAG